MEIREIINKEEWEGFLQGCTQKTFLHAWAWGEFQELMREKVWRFGLYAAPQERGEPRPDWSSGREAGELLAVVLAVKVKAKRGTFLLVPHGPVSKISNFPAFAKASAGTQLPISNQFSSINFQILEALVFHLKKLAHEEGAAFIRINPIWERGEENNEIFKELGFRGAPLQMHPEASWKLALTPPEEQLFSAMRKTTRYLIRKAMNNRDITVEQSSSVSDVAAFSAMHNVVSERQAFVPFSREYLEKEFKVFAKENGVRLFFAKVKGEIATAAFVVFWSGIGFYHHAASLPQYAKLSLPYLLQWHAIKEAKRRGCRFYDFWGYVDPKEQPKHPWAGPTLFKQGFGGKAHLYVRTQDYPLSWKYWLTAFFESARRMQRRL